jgi:putative transposase
MAFYFGIFLLKRVALITSKSLLAWMFVSMKNYPFIESFNDSFRDECLNVNWFLSLDNACNKIVAWRQEYNNYRPHSSLKRKNPNETENLYKNKSEFSTLEWS